MFFSLLTPLIPTHYATLLPRSWEKKNICVAIGKTNKAQFVIRNQVLVGFQIYFNSLYNSATMSGASRIFNKEGHVWNALYFPSS